MAVNIIIEPEFCKGSDCSFCIQICPRNVLIRGRIQSHFGGTVPEVQNQDDCTICRQCELHCPELCISIEA